MRRAAPLPWERAISCLQEGWCQLRLVGPFLAGSAGAPWSITAVIALAEFGTGAARGIARD